MAAVLSPALSSRLSGFLAAGMGLNFPEERWGDLARGMAAAAAEFGYRDAAACAEGLLSRPLTHADIEILASHLTVGETYFFREPQSLEALESHVLPALLEARRGAARQLRLWSAGCCTGEEAYTLAMLLDRLLPDAETWHLSVLATDINARFLRRAAEGIYGEWSFRATPSWLCERYFTRRRDGGYQITSKLRRHVTFAYLNLADDVYPSLLTNTNAMDVILCRNVLMYLTPERVRSVVGHLRRALVDGGWLIVSPAEASNTLFSDFATVEFPGAMLYQRQDRPGRHPVATATAATQSGRKRPGRPRASAAATAGGSVPRVSVPAAGRWPPPAAESPPPSDAADMARRHANAGALDEAALWCERAIAGDKLDPRHHFLLASIRQEQGEIDAAVQACQRALYLDPDFVLAHFALGNLRLAQGRPEDAARQFEQARRLLQAISPETVLPESEGLDAGRLSEITAALCRAWPRAEGARG